METWLRVVSVGIFCVSLATAAGNGSSNECTFKGKTYDVGEYTLDSYCWKCQCQLTTEGPTVVCKALNPICLIVRKRDTGTLILYSLSRLSWEFHYNNQWYGQNNHHIELDKSNIYRPCQTRLGIISFKLWSGCLLVLRRNLEDGDPKSLKS